MKLHEFHCFLKRNIFYTVHEILKQLPKNSCLKVVVSIQFFMVVDFWYPNQHFKVSEQFKLIKSLINAPEIITTIVIGLRTLIYDLTHEHVLIAMEHYLLDY